jgi:hypothetical protein
MNCTKILDMVYKYLDSDPDSEISMPLLDQIQVWLHTFICPDCTRQIELFESSLAVMRDDFFPYSPNLTDSIMAKTVLNDLNNPNLLSQEHDYNDFHDYIKESHAAPGGLSIRGWVIAGLIILVSLATASFGLDFKKLADETGISFLLPVGITIGIVLTSYCALFIGSHLKELSERFGL